MFALVVIYQALRVRNEVIEREGLRFRVLSANSRRIHSLRVTPLNGMED